MRRRWTLDGEESGENKLRRFKKLVGFYKNLF
jgi:hypothetical protein